MALYKRKTPADELTTRQGLPTKKAVALEAAKALELAKKTETEINKPTYYAKQGESEFSRKLKLKKLSQ